MPVGFSCGYQSTAAGVHQISFAAFPSVRDQSVLRHFLSNGASFRGRNRRGESGEDVREVKCLHESGGEFVKNLLPRAACFGGGELLPRYPDHPSSRLDSPEYLATPVALAPVWPRCIDSGLSSISFLNGKRTGKQHLSLFVVHKQICYRSTLPPIAIICEVVPTAAEAARAVVRRTWPSASAPVRANLRSLFYR